MKEDLIKLVTIKWTDYWMPLIYNTCSLQSEMIWQVFFKKNNSEKILQNWNGLRVF